MKRKLGAVAQGAIMELARLSPTLEGEMFEQRASLPDTGRARRKSLAPFPPLFTIKLFQGGLRFVPLLLFAPVQDFEQGLGGRIACALTSVTRAWFGIGIWLQERLLRRV